MLEEDNWLPFPEGLIAGDGAYPIFKNWLVTPFRCTTPNPRERAFNAKFIKSRVKIENIFGIVKNKV
jgi:hypothetical protein